MLLITGQSIAQNRILENGKLELKGFALLNDSPTSSYTISVYLAGQKIDSIFCKTKRAVYFNLNFNKVYSILYQKEGFKDKIIIVDTMIPDGMKIFEGDTHEFDVEMSEDLVRDSNEIEDFPVAILLLDKKEKMLVLCEKYHAFIHSEDVYAFKSDK